MSDSNNSFDNEKEKMKTRDGLPLSSQIGRNTMVLSIAKVLSIGLRFTALSVALQAVGEADMAIYTLLGTFISFCSLISYVGTGGITLCLPSFVADFHAKSRIDKISDILSMSMILSIILLLMILDMVQMKEV